MNPVLTICPVCSERLSVTKLQCRNCDTVIEGHFEIGRMGKLNSEQLQFIETFMGPAKRNAVGGSYQDIFWQGGL